MTTTETTGSQGATAPQDDLLDIRHLKMYFPVTAGVFRRKVADVKAVDDVSLTIRRGETLAIVGESGSGKTTLGRAILRLYKPTAGEIWFDGTDLANMKPGGLKPYKQRMQIIFQDPYSSLNPRLSAGSIVGEPLQVHNLTASRGEYNDRVAQLFSTVGLNPNMVNRYPHEFSGGQRQRIGIARALAMQPEFIVADEPVSALDVSVQAQVLNLLDDLQDQFNLTYMLVAHDLSVVRHTADRVVVMYLGKIVELSSVKDLFENPVHPYTKALMSAALPSHPDIQREEIILPGEVPSPLYPPSGCNFHPRCPWAMERCSQEEPVLETVSEGHQVSCHLY